MDKITCLAKFSPPEVLLLTEGKSAPLPELLRLTFMHLLFHQVLRMEEVSRNIGRTNEVRTYRYVTPGKKFREYVPISYEQGYITPFSGNPELQILFQHMVKIGYQFARSPKVFQSRIWKSTNLSGLAKKLVFGGIRLNERGEEVREMLHAEIAWMNANFADCLQSDRERAHEIAAKIQSNIFLFGSADPKFFGQESVNFTPESSGYVNRFQETLWPSFFWVEPDSFSYPGGCNSDSGCSGCASDGCSGCSGD